MTRRATNLLALTSGCLFGGGLLVSGMADPQRVLDFLDVAGHWNPSLALVMVGAIGAAWVPVRLAMRRSRSLLGGPMEFPRATRITRRLAVGSVLFGVGWGLCGVCPGPALVNLVSLRTDRWVYFASMLVGMALFDAWNRRSSAAAQATHPAQAGQAR